MAQYGYPQTVHRPQILQTSAQPYQFQNPVRTSQPYLVNSQSQPPPAPYSSTPSYPQPNLPPQPYAPPTGYTPSAANQPQTGAPAYIYPSRTAPLSSKNTPNNPATQYLPGSSHSTTLGQPPQMTGKPNLPPQPSGQKFAGNPNLPAAISQSVPPNNAPSNQVPVAPQLATKTSTIFSQPPAPTTKTSMIINPANGAPLGFQTSPVQPQPASLVSPTGRTSSISSIQFSGMYSPLPNTQPSSAQTGTPSVLNSVQSRPNLQPATLIQPGKQIPASSASGSISSPPMGFNYPQYTSTGPRNEPPTSDKTPVAYYAPTQKPQPVIRYRAAPDPQTQISNGTLSQPQTQPQSQPAPSYTAPQSQPSSQAPAPHVQYQPQPQPSLTSPPTIKGTIISTSPPVQPYQPYSASPISQPVRTPIKDEAPVRSAPPDNDPSNPTNNPAFSSKPNPFTNATAPAPSNSKKPADDDDDPFYVGDSDIDRLYYEALKRSEQILGERSALRQMEREGINALLH